MAIVKFHKRPSRAAVINQTKGSEMSRSFMVNLLSRRFVGLSLVVAAGLTISGAAHAVYPDHPITMVVPFAVGSNSDIVARSITNKLGELLKQNIVVDNKGAASGIVGADFVAKARPDGYTILFGTSTTQAINPSLFSKVPYDPVKDFASVSRVGFVPMILVVDKKSPINSVAELIAYSKANPGGRVKYGTLGAGTVPHLAGAYFDKLAGIDTLHVPYTAAGQLFTDVVSGDITYLFYPYAGVGGQITSGQFKPLAVVAPQRVSWLPNVPAMPELGYRDFTMAASVGIYAPKGVSKDILDVLAKATDGALHDPDVQRIYLASGTVIAPLSPADTDKATLDEIKLYHDLIMMTGAKAE